MIHCSKKESKLLIDGSGEDLLAELMTIIHSLLGTHMPDDIIKAAITAAFEFHDGDNNDCVIRVGDSEKTERTFNKIFGDFFKEQNNDDLY